jgi:hypothetical protein
VNGEKPAMLTPTGKVPTGHWVGFGDDRRYLLATDQWGWAWGWFRTEDGWDHTLDPAWGMVWSVHDAASQEDRDSLARHVERIRTDGCGARGYCRDHAR